MSWIQELSLEISSEVKYWTPPFFHLTPGLTKLTISAKTAFDCADCFAAIVRGALPELQTLCIHLRDVTTDPIHLSPLLELVRERHVEGRPLKKVFIHDEELEESYTKTLTEIASYVDTLECDSSPSPFENSNTGPVYASLPDELRSWRWQDEFR
ncbi:hypothetical protein EW146_g8552 [Bondarzewia mesenterica]|uniref:Uncharacterized protein n=1 Tax=Bondarzewia mesenterica TaxID=1095465 RepID=A0A4S4LF73_9AGAM|nr:hypothetical protein EW146_g8552 [Bondarzewia mesenterica]